ncbi:MAG: EamA family transporter [Thermoleophilia bacterium]|nr:EamA family transporter [Thermoleophilia bacterium]
MAEDTFCGGAVRLPRYVPVLALAALALIWGYSWIPGKLGVVNSNAFVFAAARTFPAGVLLLMLLPVFGRPLRPKAFWLTAVVGVLQVGGFVGLISAALVAGGAGHTAMLANTWQFWLLIVAWWFLGERLRGGQWLSVGLALVGLLLIIEPWGLHGVLSSLLALGAAVSFAAGATVAKVLRRRHKVDLLSLTAWQTLLGSVPLVIVAAISPGDGIQWNSDFVWSFAYCVVISTALGSLLWLYTLNALPANMAGIGTIGTPVVGVLASWLQLDEQLSGSEITGMVLVVVALGLLVLRGLRSAKAP